MNQENKLKQFLLNTLDKEIVNCSHIDIDHILPLHLEYKDLNFNSYLEVNIIEKTSGMIFKASNYPPYPNNKYKPSHTLITKDWNSKIIDNSFYIKMTNGGDGVGVHTFVCILTKVKNPDTGKFNRVLEILVSTRNYYQRKEIIVDYMLNYFKHLRVACGIKYVRNPFDNTLIGLVK